MGGWGMGAIGIEEEDVIVGFTLPVPGIPLSRLLFIILSPLPPLPSLSFPPSYPYLISPSLAYSLSLPSLSFSPSLISLFLSLPFNLVAPWEGQKPARLA